MTNLLVLGLLASDQHDKIKCVEIVKNIITKDFEMEFVCIDLNYIITFFELNMPNDINNNLVNNIENAAFFDRFYLDSKSQSQLEELFVIASIFIMKQNSKKENKTNCVYLIEFLRTQHEVELFRQLFGLNFFNISVLNNSECSASNLLTTHSTKSQMPISKSKFFFQSEMLVDMSRYEASSVDLKRFLDLIFGNPFVTPNRSKHFIFYM
jgi:hypothetical protein